MRWAAILIGAFLIVFGVLSFTNRFPGKFFSVTNTTTQENQTDTNFEDESAIQKNTVKNTFPLAPILGVISIAGGLYLVGKAISEGKREPGLDRPAQSSGRQ